MQHLIPTTNHNPINRYPAQPHLLHRSWLTTHLPPNCPEPQLTFLCIAPRLPTNHSTPTTSSMPPHPLTLITYSTRNSSDTRHTLSTKIMRTIWTHNLQCMTSSPHTTLQLHSMSPLLSTTLSTTMHLIYTLILYYYSLMLTTYAPLATDIQCTYAILRHPLDPRCTLHERTYTRHTEPRLTSTHAST